MYVIIAYDVSVERVNKVKKFLRTHLTWVQNSLFEGELGEAALMKVRKGLSDRMDAGNDTITIYLFPGKKVFVREDLGIKKGDPNERVI